MATKPEQREEERRGTGAAAPQKDEACSAEIDRNAPAGSPNSLGAKSDCGGRPATDDSVVEAKDEMGPGAGKPAA